MNLSMTRSQLSVLFFLHSAAAACYYPNGSIMESLEFQPCSSVANAMVMCCATNRIPRFQDICQSNGLCYNPCNDDGCGPQIIGKYWRESCTDQSWESPFCLKGVCTKSTVSWNELADFDRCGKLMRLEWRESKRHHDQDAMPDGRQLVLRECSP